MSGGGKGGSETTTSGIPDWVQAPAERNIARAETAQKVGYMPYYGPDIAAFNPTQNAAFNSNIGAAEAFGMVPQGSLTAMQGMAPQANTYAGGLQAYSSGDLFDQALAELKTRRPGQVAQYDKMFVDPFTGAQPEPVVAPGPKQGDVIQLGQNRNIPAQNRNFQPMWNPAPEGYVSMGNGFAMYKG
tara:strand:- start:421 stop:978 length:558 start_codon:yes stop_codon:yes gene_type:complete